MKLEDEVEELFTKNFAEEDRRKTMKYLKPHQRKESHTVTFSIGELLAIFNQPGLIKLSTQDNVFNILLIGPFILVESSELGVTVTKVQKGKKYE